ncbi:MAG: hypothetical protein QXS92_04010, partial [Thermofilum sp.]
KPRIKAICMDHRLVTPDQVILEPKRYEESLREAYAQAFNLAVNAAMPLPEVVGLLVRRARAEALAVAAEAAIVTPETAPLVLAKAEAAAKALYEAVRRRNPSL